MKKETSIKILQYYATNLAAQSNAHKVQGKVFAAQGFSALGSKYAEHATEEMGNVDKFIDRIIDLGGEAKVEASPEFPVFKDVLDFLKADLQISKTGIEELRKHIDSVQQDYTTFDMLKEYLKDEEEDMYWTEQQLELIDKIGLQNWLIKQI